MNWDFHIICIHEIFLGNLCIVHVALRWSLKTPDLSTSARINKLLNCRKIPFFFFNPEKNNILAI